MFRILPIAFLLLFIGNFLFAQEAKLMLPIGITDRASDARFSPDGKKLVTPSSDGTLKIWDAATGNQLADLKGHPYINSVQFSPDGGKIMMASGDGTVMIWDVLSTNLLLEITAHSYWLNSAQFSPDGKKIVTASFDHTARIWDAVSGKLLATLTGHTHYCYSAQFSPDGKKIVTASFDHTARIWDALTGNVLTELRGHTHTLTSAAFSPASPDDPSGGKKIVTASVDQTAMVWETATGKRLALLKGHTNNASPGPEIIPGNQPVKFWPAAERHPARDPKIDNNYLNSAQFSPDGKKIVTLLGDSTARIWDAVTGNLLQDLKGQSSFLTVAQFSPDGNKIVTASGNGIVSTWDAASGKKLLDINASRQWFYAVQFSADGKKLVTASYSFFSTVGVWDATTGGFLFDLKGHAFNVSSVQYSPDGKKFVPITVDKTAKIWDAATGIIVAELKGHTNRIQSVQFSPACPDDPTGGNKIATAGDSTARIWDAATGRKLTELKGHKDRILTMQFSPDGKKIVTASFDSTAKIWDAATGLLLADLTGGNGFIRIAQFSPASPDDPVGGKKVLTTSRQNINKIWDAATGKLLADLNGHRDWVPAAHFSPDGKKIVTGSYDSTAKIWDAATGKLLADLRGHRNSVTNVQFSPDGKKIVTASFDSTAKIWDAVTGMLLAALTGHSGGVNEVQFSTDGKKIVTASSDKTAKIWDAVTGKLRADLKGHNDRVGSARFTPDDKKIITSSLDKTSKTWDAATGELLFSFFAVDSTDYLVFDKYNRYDGSPAARKLIYFTCGTEVIELEQVKDQLWVPNLAERILNGETIQAQKLSDLNICNLTPVVETREQTSSQYRFQITPRLGGLGASIIYVNGIEVKRYTPQQLSREQSAYLLEIDKKELQPFFVPGKENSIVIKSLTATSSISSRSGSLTDKRTETVAALPNLYAVIVGVSDYKGEEMDLRYAAKDAADIATAMEMSAKKLLNTDGKEHVFVTKIHTGAGRDKFPEKNSIKQVFTDIATKAKPNDILLIFFAGHGVTEAEKNQFYFLTADASKVTVSSALKNVGISTDELTEWIKPQVMKAQKRILILDACNSGQVLQGVLSVEKLGQNFQSASPDSRARQVKAIDKLNERSGMFILSASASDQKAYEMSTYKQGVLTYALLKAIKEDPDILEDRRYLNLSRWFNAAEKSVNDLARETGARQQPQIVSTTNFNIGVVDEEVKNKILLPFEKHLFTRSDFRNTELRIDNLKLRALVDKQLSELADPAGSGSILYSPEYDGEKVYSISGDYTLKNNEITVSLILTKGGTEIVNRMEIKELQTNQEELAKKITRAVLDWLKKHE